MSSGDYTSNPEAYDFIAGELDAVQKPALDGRFFGISLARVTNNKDPLRCNRLKVNLPWQRPDEETDWIKQGTLFAGPTDPQRGIEAWGLDYPIPEVNQDVFVFFSAGDPTDGYYFGMPRYSERDRTVPRIAKDNFPEYSFRIKLPNGYDWGIATTGSLYELINGHERRKVQGNSHHSARGKHVVTATRIVHGALSVLRAVFATFAPSQYIRPQDDPELRDLFVDTMRGTPGKQDPGIRKPKDLS